MRKLSLISSATLIVALSGSASIVTDSTASVNLMTSNGQQTEIMIDGQAFSAPGIAQVHKTGQDKIVIADSETCQGQTVLPKKVEMAFWGNILIGGLLGSTTDYSTQKMWTYADTAIINCGG